MSDQTIEVTPLNIAYYYVAYCIQNNIKVNESKIDNYVERMQKPLISDSVKEDFENLIYDHAKNFSKNKLSNYRKISGRYRKKLTKKLAEAIAEAIAKL